MRSIHSRTVVSVGSEDQSTVIQALQDQIVSAKKVWQQHSWELECQVRDLKAELEDLRSARSGKCETCGSENDVATEERKDSEHPKKRGVVNRPRARTGVGAARFAGGQ